MIVTIGREKGSGGHYAGQLLAERLGIPCYDKALLIETAKKSGFSQEFIEAHEEKTPTSRYASLTAGILSSEYSHPVHQQVFEAQSKVIREIAAQGPCVFVGRCADFVLRDRTDVVNCFVHAPLPKRIARIMKLEHISQTEAERLIRKTDKSRASYYTFFTDRTWGEAKNYHLAVDTAIATIPGVVDFIVDLIAKAENRKDV